MRFLVFILGLSLTVPALANSSDAKKAACKSSNMIFQSYAQIARQMSEMDTGDEPTPEQMLGMMGLVCYGIGRLETTTNLTLARVRGLTGETAEAARNAVRSANKLKGFCGIKGKNVIEPANGYQMFLEMQSMHGYLAQVEELCQ